MRISDWSSDVLLFRSYWLKADDRLTRELAITQTIKTPVNFIVHTIQEVNDGLAHGRYSFMDVRRDGIALYQTVDDELHEPKPKTPESALAMAEEYFEAWFPGAMQKYEEMGRASWRGRGGQDGMYAVAGASLKKKHRIRQR